jgi:16S rRNA processing protein RimM
LQVKFTGIDGRDEAFALRGYTIEIDRADFAPAEEGEYYWADLVGMRVVNREGIELGKVANLMETGAHDVLMVNGEHGQKLIPFVAHYIDHVDNDSRTITADWGLDY